MVLRTLIVDDTVIWRKILSESISTFKELELVGTAANGEIALKKIEQLKPDLIFLDVHMPGIDGIELLKKLGQSHKEIAVIMVSTDASTSTRATVEALQSGAIDFICKPTSSNHNSNIESLKKDIKSMLRLLEIKHLTHNIQPRSPKPAVVPAKVSPEITEPPKGDIPKSFSICVIGVSTGGPDALNRLIPNIPADFPLPILLVQHMPPHFTKSLADSLNKKSQITVKEANENDPITAGTVFIAPGGKHMVLRMVQGKPVIGLNDEPPENSCRPSVDVLFRSVAAHYGDSGVLAIILTGMGCDGLNGIRTLKRKSCLCITQSEASCVVYGMPRAVDEAHLSDNSLPIESIASEMTALTRSSIFHS